MSRLPFLGNLDNLERPCTCRDEWRSFGDTCQRCHGSGLEPTDSGRALLEFLERHLPTHVTK
jgi:hypothetical protein